MNNSPLFSFVIPTRNRSSRLIKLLSSIISMDTHNDLEVVVVDNASDINHWVEVKEFCLKFRSIRLYRNDTDIGMTPNWNKAIGYASGEWICFMCDDDSLLPDSLIRVRKYISYYKPPFLILQNTLCKKDIEWLEPAPNSARKILLPPAAGQFWHRNITNNLGGFDTRIKYCPDAEFWPRIASNYPVLMVKDLLSQPNQHDTNYMWVAFKSEDFLEQVEISIRLTAKHILGENFSNKSTLEAFVDDGMWETLRTVINNTFLMPGKMRYFFKYVKAFYKLSLKLGRFNIMIKTFLKLPTLRAKDIYNKLIRR